MSFFSDLFSRWGRFKSLLIKEFRVIWNDPKNRNMVMISPVIQLIVFAYAVSLEVKNIKIAVNDQNKTSYSREYIGKIENTEMVKGMYYVNNMTEMRDLINKQKAVAGITIAQDFDKNIILKNGKASVQLITDGRKTIEAQIISGYVNLITQLYEQDLVGGGSAVDINYRYWYNPTLDHQWSMVISLTGMMTMMMALSITSLSIAQEKELGVYDQIIVAPLKSYEILFAKTFIAMALSSVDLIMMMAVALFHFKIPLTTNIFVVSLVTNIFLLSICGIGLFISSLCETQQQAILGMFVATIPMMLISGFITTIENMPYIFRVIARVNPLTYFFTAFKGMFLKSMPYHLILKNTLPLIYISIFTLTFSCLYFHRKRL